MNMNLNDHLVFLPIKCNHLQDYFDYDELVGYGGMDQLALEIDGQKGLVVEKTRVNDFLTIIRKFEEWNSE